MIEAKKVPTLVPFFNAKSAGTPMPIVSTTNAGGFDPAQDANIGTAQTIPDPALFNLQSEVQPNVTETSSGNPAPNQNVCTNHQEVPSKLSVLHAGPRFAGNV